MRIVQLANFWTPTSGGLRTVMDRLARGYAERGHDVLQVVPGASDTREPMAWGVRATVSSPQIPGAGGYRVIVRLRHVEQLVRADAADAIEVSDRATLAHLARRWQHGPTRVVLVAHERLDHILTAGACQGAVARRMVRPLADRWNPRCRRGVDEVVAPSHFAADEWRRVGIVPHVVPWGVDLDTYRPIATDGTGALRLCWAGRLAPEKRPGLAIDAIRSLRASGTPSELTVVGDGPLRGTLEAEARDLPVRFAGHLAAPSAVAAELARASVVLSTSGIETFGLTVLESMACGTPVVAVEGGAAAEVAGDAGRAVPADGASIAAAALDLHRGAVPRSLPRRRAERFTWDRAVEAMLAVHAPTGVVT